MDNREGAFHKAPRPLYLWLGVSLGAVAVVGLGVFTFRVLNAIAIAFERAAENGHSVPDMSGGLPALITAIVGLLGMVLPQVMNALTARNRQRLEEVRQGTAPTPFPSSAPSAPPSPLPDTEGPRPWQNRE